MCVSVDEFVSGLVCVRQCECVSESVSVSVNESECE